MSRELKQQWRKEQYRLASLAKWTDHNLSFSTPVVSTLPASSPDPGPHPEPNEYEIPVLRHQDPLEATGFKGLKYVGGLDIGFRENGEANDAIATLAVMEFPSMKLITSLSQPIILSAPYVPSYLSMRESTPLLSLLTTFKSTHSSLFPQIILIDGNGRLHPREAGLATVVGVLGDVPTIGVGKEYYPKLKEEREKEEVENEKKNEQVKDSDTTTTFSSSTKEIATTTNKDKNKTKRNSHTGHFRQSQKGFRQKVSKILKTRGDWIGVVNEDNDKYFGAALRSSPDPISTNPIYVSSGHQISLPSAVALVLACCTEARVPEPVRQADAIGRKEVKHRWGKEDKEMKMKNEKVKEKEVGAIQEG